MEDAAKTILSSMKSFIVDGIKYTKLGKDEFYAQELFETKELYGYLEKNMIESKYSVYDHIIYDSDKEKEFAEKFENNENVKVFAKLSYNFV